MRTRTFMLAAVAVALWGAGQAAHAQFGNMGGSYPGAPAGPYPNVMAPTYMPDAGYGGAMAAAQGPYAPPAFNPASYAGIGGPAPMGPTPASPSMMPMGGMPMPAGPGGPDYGGGDYGGGYGEGGYCPPAGWSNHYFGFGEFLYLRPSNAEVAYAVPINSAAAGTGVVQQTGKVHVADPDYAPAFRTGFGAVVSPRSAFAVTYSQFDRDTFDALDLPGAGSVVQSLVTSPNPLTAAGNGLAAAALLRTNFKILDLDYKGLLVFNPQWQVNYVLGARYAQLGQHLAAGFAANTGFQQVLAESEFDGGGLKLGLEGLRFHPTTQFFWYGKGYTSFVAGTFRARYESDPAQQGSPTIAQFSVGRVVTMLDLETGLGWQNFTGNLRFSAGYMFTAWNNTVRVNDFINGVQGNNFILPSSDLRGLMVFDGLTSKVEVLW